MTQYSMLLLGHFGAIDLYIVDLAIDLYCPTLVPAIARRACHHTFF